MIFIIFLFSSRLSCLYSQWFVEVGGGYAFGWAPDDIPDGNINEIESGIRNIEISNTSFGAGIHYNATVGRKISNILKIECQFAYLDGKTYRRQVKFISAELNEYYSGNILWIAPGINIELNQNKKISPYARIGIAIGILGKIQRNQVIDDKQNTIIESEFTFSKGVALGVSSSIGLQYNIPTKSNINNRWKIFSEIRLLSSSYGPDEGNFEKYLVNGVEQISTFSINQKTVEYKDNYLKNENQPIDDTKPTIALKRYYPFSSLGVNIGIVFSF